MKYYYRFRYDIDMTKPTSQSCLESIKNIIEFNGWQPVPHQKNTYGLPIEKAIEALASVSYIEEIYFDTYKVLTEFTWFEGDVEENVIEDWLRNEYI